MTVLRRRAVGFLAAPAIALSLGGPGRGQVPLPLDVIPPGRVAVPVPVPIAVPVQVPFPVPAPRPVSDPTVPDPRLRDILNPPKAPPAGAAAKSSDLRLRGRVIAGARAAAILEIDGQTFVLPAGGEARSVRVRAVTAEGVTVEVGASKDLKVLH